jgi:diaminohydroxyphosphoribosylaminopyrimidine deaminase/5-amino-6-(5-phosphoribosylamino)uracil reductase
VISEQDVAFMRRALALAERGRGRTSPNPLVGALVVRDGAILGEGYHARAGEAHAEVAALAACRESPRGATLYVTLEPCRHAGRTPPCTAAIVAAGIRRVVAATRDSNPLMDGAGLAELRAHGIDVTAGVLEAEARRQNEAFFTFIRTGRPFAHLKAALSLDGKIATRTGESRWITGEAARRRVHEWRDAVDAVLVGIGTVLADDPLLTTRLDRPGARDPARVVVDSRGRLPLTARVLTGGSPVPTFVAVSPAAPAERLAALQRAGARVLRIDGPGPGVDLPGLLLALGKLGMTRVMFEGGARLNAAALAAGIVDHCLLFLAPVLIGGHAAPGLLAGGGVDRLAQAPRLREVAVERLGDDLLISGYLGTQHAALSTQH